MDSPGEGSLWSIRFGRRSMRCWQRFCNKGCRRAAVEGLAAAQSAFASRIARVLFAVEGDTMYLLHGFIKTTTKTPQDDLALARKRWNKIKR